MECYSAQFLFIWAVHTLHCVFRLDHVVVSERRWVGRASFVNLRIGDVSYVSVVLAGLVLMDGQIESSGPGAAPCDCGWNLWRAGARSGRGASLHRPP